jgi:PEGA domain
MKRTIQFSLIALLAALCIAPVASARPRVFIGGYFGPGFFGPAYYGPAWYGPGWEWGAPYGYERGPVTGSVKIETKDKNAEVYVDGGYAGTVGELKTIKLRPGDHNIELRDRDGRSFYQERVNVIAGKTAKLAA